MKYLFNLMKIIIVVLLVFLAQSSITNTSDFFATETGSRLLGQSYAGYEDVDWYFPKGSASIYYSLWQGFNKDWTDKSAPLIIWLQGGPGGSSQFGCFNQIGPVYIEGKKGNQKATQNPWSWNYFGHLLFVDQPVGVGFSFNNNSKKVDNSRDAADHFINFMVNFFKNNRNFTLNDNPIYLAGQSYAGHYIPIMARLINTNTSLPFKLTGILLGDGWVDPLLQGNNYDSYLNSVGAVSNQWRDTTGFMSTEALVRIMRGDLKEAAGYINFIIADDSVADKYYLGMNVLNYKQYDDGNINPDYSFYLQSKKKSFGVPDWVSYIGDNQQMYEDFSADISKSYRSDLERVLNLGINTLIYNGQNDFIVNTAGTLAYLNSMEWQFAKPWKAREKTTWIEDGENRGWYKKYRNLAFVMVRNAGHLVPSDQPRAAWDMLDNYFLNLW